MASKKSSQKSTNVGYQLPIVSERSLQKATKILQLVDIESIEHFLKQLEELLGISIDFGSNVVARVNSAVEKINSLDSDESKLKEELSECKKKLQDTKNKAVSFEERVRKFFDLADIDEATAKTIKESLQKNNKTPLEAHLETLTRYLMRCAEFYEDFQKVYQETEKLCRKTSSECNAKKVEAKNRKYVARAVGGGAAVVGVGGVIGGGVAASVVVGFFTFGIGTVVGLAITSVAAAGTIAAGAGTAGVAGVTSHLVARNFEKIQKTFQGICEDLDKVNESVTDLGMRMSSWNTLILESVNCDRKNVQAELENKMSANQLCRSFDVLQEGIKKLKPRNPNASTAK